jgi:pilus assembly protein Flp/PilA
MIGLASALAQMVGYVRTRFARESGAAAVEYGLLVALIAAVIVGVVLILGQQVNTAFCEVSDGIAAATGGGASCPAP